ncbi:MAG: HaeIII family restriction endonuclease [Fibromonadaceae bacterium]|jgi:hypothetical protein|nr:HaeIII family restriction endonuclease [Fibromonadaceae bacterium]
MEKKAKQTETGKAFEYALLKVFLERLKSHTKISAIENEPYKTAKKCYDNFGIKERELYNLNASLAVDFLNALEPRLANSMNTTDILQLEIMADKEGQSGDVRDVLAIRSLQKWEIGFSAKNNHRAVKHSRLSEKLDFGNVWLNIPCSENYFNKIKPIFSKLRKLREESNATKKWSSLGDYQSMIYVPVLDAFKAELEFLNRNNEMVAKKLVEYLIGNRDFYKIIKSKNEVVIQAYNLHGTLNLPAKNVKSKFKIQKLKLPNRLIEIVYKDNSKTTLLVVLSHGWQISFRIHNASSKVEPSLKFDINLISSPSTLFEHHLPLGNL